MEIVNNIYQYQFLVAALRWIHDTLQTSYIILRKAKILLVKHVSRGIFRLIQL